MTQPSPPISPTIEVPRVVAVSPWWQSHTVLAALAAGASFVTALLPVVPEKYKPLLNALGGLLAALGVLLGKRAATNAADQASQYSGPLTPPPLKVRLD